MKIIRNLLLLLIVITNTSIARANINEPCPNNLVNFWKEFAFNTNNYDSIPAFLLQNNCFRAPTSTAFHTAMTHRFDEPGNETYINELYAQLEWTVAKPSIQQE